MTCDIDESNEDPGQDSNDENGKMNLYNGEPAAHRDSPTGEENPNQKYSNDKSFSPSSSVSSSSSGSSSAYKKISDIFNRDKKQEKIMEMEENPIVIIPQVKVCPILYIKTNLLLFWICMVFKAIEVQGCHFFIRVFEKQQ